MKKLLALLLAAVLCPPSFAAVPDKDIVILFTNDVHCGVDENIGYAGLAYYRNEARRLTPYVTLVDAGDWSQGETIGSIAQGRYILEIMNALSYDVAVPGNHEFNYGWSQFENFARNLTCGFISCNLRDLRTGGLVFAPCKMFTYGDVKVAFVGACTPESITKSNPSSFKDESGKRIYGFDEDSSGEKIIAAVQRAVDDARSEGADYVIVVGHLGEYEDVTEVWSAPYIAARTHGIDAFIDGHSHEETPSLVIKNSDGKNTVITQTGTKLANIGKLTITASGQVKTELIASVQGRDEKITALIQDIKARYEDTITQHLSYTSFDLKAKDENGDWLTRNGENILCDIAADAFLASSHETKTGKADIALLNAGTLRNNIKAGEIVFGDVLSVMPFPNTLCIMEISGQTLLDELELGACALPKPYGGFLHASGLTFTIDTRIPSPVKVDETNTLLEISGERRIRDVKVNGEDIDPGKYYKVVGTSFTLSEGGDGHIFRGAKLIEPDYIVQSDALVHYLKKFEVLPVRYRENQGRITVIQ